MDVYVSSKPSQYKALKNANGNFELHIPAGTYNAVIFAIGTYCASADCLLISTENNQFRLELKTCDPESYALRFISPCIQSDTEE